MIKRIGNDIVINWEVWLDDKKTIAEDFTGADIEVYAVHPRSGKKALQEFSVQGNVITVQFTANEQFALGFYDLTLKYQKSNPSIEGGIATYTRDICDAFILVAKSCDVPDSQDINVVSVILKGDKGNDGITPHVGANNNWWIADLDVGIKAKGEDGIDGREIKLSNDRTNIKWKYEGGEWTNLIALSELKGVDGREVELINDGTNIKWRLTGDILWTNLIALSELKGDKGDANTLSVGTVISGAEADATITGEAPNQTLNFVLPKGDKGDKGDTGDIGKSAFQDYYDNTSDNPKLTQEEWNLLQAETPSKEQERQLNEQGRVSNENSRLSTYENLEQAAAAALNEMAGRIEALERILREYKLTYADIDTLNYKTMTKEGCPLYYESDSAPTIVPDFVGQKFYKTTSPYAVYEAVGVTSVSHWVLL